MHCLPRAGRAVSGRKACVRPDLVSLVLRGFIHSMLRGLLTIRCLAYTPRITTHIVGRAGGLSCDVRKKLLFVLSYQSFIPFYGRDANGRDAKEPPAGFVTAKVSPPSLFIGDMLSRIKPPLHLTTDQIAENLQPVKEVLFSRLVPLV